MPSDIAARAGYSFSWLRRDLNDQMPVLQWYAGSMGPLSYAGHGEVVRFTPVVARLKRTSITQPRYAGSTEVHH